MQYCIWDLLLPLPSAPLPCYDSIGGDTMIDRCASILHKKLEELRLLLDLANLPSETAQAIRAELERMEQLIADMTKDRD